MDLSEPSVFCQYLDKGVSNGAAGANNDSAHDLDA